MEDRPSCRDVRLAASVGSAEASKNRVSLRRFGGPKQRIAMDEDGTMSPQIHASGSVADFSYEEPLPLGDKIGRVPFPAILVLLSRSPGTRRPLDPESLAVSDSASQELLERMTIANRARNACRMRFNLILWRGTCHPPATMSNEIQREYFCQNSCRFDCSGVDVGFSVRG